MCVWVWGVCVFGGGVWVYVCWGKQTQEDRKEANYLILDLNSFLTDCETHLLVLVNVCLSVCLSEERGELHFDAEGE